MNLVGRCGVSEWASPAAEYGRCHTGVSPSSPPSGVGVRRRGNTSNSGRARNLSHTLVPDINDTCLSDVPPPKSTYTLVFFFSAAAAVVTFGGEVEDETFDGDDDEGRNMFSRWHALSSMCLRTAECERPTSAG